MMCNDKDYEPCDEEKSFIDWLKNTEVSQYDLSVVRKAYMDGFAAGWNNKKIYNAQEWLEK
jgi:hypothetical protein